jgi:hypothetical protein
MVNREDFSLGRLLRLTETNQEIIRFTHAPRFLLLMLLT